MKIKEICVQRYDILRPFSAKFDKNVCIIFGPGGSGKTLMIDAILKMLLGGNASGLIRHQGIDEMPAGYMVIEKDGEEYKIDTEKHLSDIPGLELDPVDLKNIFVIQDADLHITEEDKFYGRVTGKLIGVRTGDIRNVKDEVRRRGRLTPGLELVDKHPLKIGQKARDAKELRQNVQEYIHEADSSGISSLEKQKFDIEWEARALEEKITLLEKAKKKLEFDKLETSLSKAKNHLKALEEMPDKNGILTLGGKLSDSRKDIEKVPSLEREANSWKTRFAYISVSTAIAFAALLAFGFEMPSIIIPAILLVITIISLLKWQQSDKSLSNIAIKRQSIVNEALDHGIRANTAEEVGVEISRISKEIDEEEAGFNQEKGILREQFEIDDSDRQQFLGKIENALTKLRSNIDHTITVEYDPDELEKAQLQRKSNSERLNQVNKDLQEHQETLADYSEQALKLQFSDEFSSFKLDFEIRNLDSLRKLTQWLDEYIGHIENDARLSREAFEIFGELESKEEAKSEELFGTDSEASKIFKDITHGMFEEVNYDSSTAEVLVKRSQRKKPQKVSELSRSEWTQLYMSIRVALGESLLKGKEGFFIVEEPFIHADHERLIREFGLVKNLSKRGWQTFYFTAKDEIKDELPKHTDASIAELERLP